jgi:hypothetical protein
MLLLCVIVIFFFKQEYHTISKFLAISIIIIAANVFIGIYIYNWFGIKKLWIIFLMSFFSITFIIIIYFHSRNPELLGELVENDVKVSLYRDWERSTNFSLSETDRGGSKNYYFLNNNDKTYLRFKDKDSREMYSRPTLLEIKNDTLVILKKINGIGTYYIHMLIPLKYEFILVENIKIIEFFDTKGVNNNITNYFEDYP